MLSFCTFPRVKSDRLMLPVSFNISPQLLLFFKRSLPARSTNNMRPYLLLKTVSFYATGDTIHLHLKEFFFILALDKFDSVLLFMITTRDFCTGWSRTMRWCRYIQAVVWSLPCDGWGIVTDLTQWVHMKRHDAMTAAAVLVQFMRPHLPHPENNMFNQVNIPYKVEHA